MSERIVITVPGCPDPVLSPNMRRKGSTHWSSIAKATRELRSDAKFAALDERGAGNDPWTLGPVAVALTVVWPKRRHLPDLDAIPGFCKAILDGVTDSGVVWADDRQMKRLIVEQEQDNESAGHVTVTVERMQEGDAGERTNQE